MVAPGHRAAGGDRQHPARAYRRADRDRRARGPRFLYSGGIKLDIDYTPAFLYQLAKMDGAIILNANATKITMANVQLMPDPTILSHETGTRHRTAERVSKQTDALVIAISQRREVVSLYVDGAKYILEDIPVVLAKANQALATLDKYRTRLDQVSTRLTALEFEGGVDAARRAHRAPALRARHAHGGRDRALHRRARQRGAADRDAARGDDGRRRRPRRRRSCATTWSTTPTRTSRPRSRSSAALAHQDLLDFGRLAELLGYDRKLNTLDYPVSPRGYRVLGADPAPAEARRRRASSASSAASTSCSPRPTPSSRRVEGVGEIRAKDIREGLRRLQEINLVDRYLQT